MRAACTIVDSRWPEHTFAPPSFGRPRRVPPPPGRGAFRSDPWQV